MWGSRRALRSVTALFAVVLQGHLLDPQQVMCYRGMVELRRILRKRQDLRQEFIAELAAQDGQPLPSAVAPVMVFRSSLRRLCWRSTPELLMDRVDYPPLSLLDGTQESFCHAVRDGLRRAAWRAEGTRVPSKMRADMSVVAEFGVDYDATVLLCRGKAPTTPLGRIILDARDALRPFEWSQYLRGTLEQILTGAVRTQERLFKAHDSNGARLVASPVCPCCGEAVVRLKKLSNISFGSVNAGMQSAVAFLSALRTLCPMPQRPGSAVAWLPSSLCSYVRVWTDGACERQADRRFRRAGFGVSLHENAEWFNRSGMVPGEQSNQRGELMALWVAFASAWCPICMVTDSQYCVTLWTRLTEDPTQSISHLDHSDVWIRLQDLLLQSQDMEERPFFVVRKTLGHADELDPDAYQAAVAAGLTVAGARLHALDESEVASYHSYARRAAFGQALMLKIWLSWVALLGDPDDPVGPFSTSPPASAAGAPVPPAPSLPTASQFDPQEASAV